MGIIRLIIWLLVFYFVYKGVKLLIQYFSGSLQSTNRTEKVDNSRIKKEDIIEADFEEIDPKKEESENSK